MRNEWLEIVLVGAAIGLAVIAIRTLIGQSIPQVQLLALVLAGAGLSLLQFRLSLRRMRQGDQPSHDRNTTRPAERRRPHRPNPFDHELTRNWTGLDERLTRPDAPRPPGTDAQLAEPSKRPTDPLP